MKATTTDAMVDALFKMGAQEVTRQGWTINWISGSAVWRCRVDGHDVAFDMSSVPSTCIVSTAKLVVNHIKRLS